MIKIFLGSWEEKFIGFHLLVVKQVVKDCTEYNFSLFAVNSIQHMNKSCSLISLLTLRGQAIKPNLIKSWDPYCIIIKTCRMKMYVVQRF